MKLNKNSEKSENLQESRKIKHQNAQKQNERDKKSKELNNILENQDYSSKNSKLSKGCLILFLKNKLKVFSFV